jgi:hypothetical protein
MNLPPESFLATLANVHTCYGFRRNRDDFLMAVLTAYFDESGIHAGDHLCVVAGFVGNDAQWQALAADWIPAIRPRKNLHMKDLRWNQHPERVRPLLAKLGPIPYKYNLKPVSVSVKWRDWNEIVQGKVREEYTNPYMLCAQTCMGGVLNSIAGPDDVYFLFDRQRGKRRKTIEKLRDIVFEWIGIDSRVKGIDFLDRATTVCLDPADYLAFIVRERGNAPDSDKATMGASIMGTKPGYGGTYTRHQLTEQVKQYIEWGMVPGGGAPKLPKEFFAGLMKNPYWRGLRSK